MNRENRAHNNTQIAFVKKFVKAAIDHFFSSKNIGRTKGLSLMNNYSHVFTAYVNKSFVIFLLILLGSLEKVGTIRLYL